MKPLPRLQWREGLKESYTSQISQLIDTLEEGENSISDLANCVREAAMTCQRKFRSNGRKKPWFDYECVTARKKSFAALRKAKKLNTEESLREYQAINKAFKDLCVNKKILYFNNLGSQLKYIKDSKDYWSVVKKLNGKSFSKGTHLSASSLESHFRGLLNQTNIEAEISFASPFIVVEDLDADITIEEVSHALEKAENKAAGPDGIPAEFYKNVPPNFVELLTNAFNETFKSGSVPALFQTATIFPLFKQGDINDPSNYRGISFQNALAKVFTFIIHARLASWVEDNSILSDFQAGFRKGFSTVDNIFCLNSIAKHYLSKKKKLYALFVDFKAAFDSILRQALF